MAGVATGVTLFPCDETGVGGRGSGARDGGDVTIRRPGSIHLDACVFQVLPQRGHGSSLDELSPTREKVADDVACGIDDWSAAEAVRVELAVFLHDVTAFGDFADLAGKELLIPTRTRALAAHRPHPVADPRVLGGPGKWPHRLPRDKANDKIRCRVDAAAAGSFRIHRWSVIKRGAVRL